MAHEVSLTVILATMLSASSAWGDALYAPANSPSGAAVSCLYRMQDELDRTTAQLSDAYQKIDPIGGSIPSGKRASVILPGTNARERDGVLDEGVLVIHGFSASAKESQDVALAISDAGFPVVMALLPGFGSSTKIANAYKYQDWIQAVDNYVDKMSLCFKKIHLVGFSLGGGLISHLALTNSRLDANGLYQSSRGPLQIKSLTLLSPYVSTKSPLKDWLSSSLHSQLGVEGLPIETLYATLMWFNMQDSANDLKAMALYPSGFNAELPLAAAGQVKLLGEELSVISALRSSRIPVFLSYSEADLTVDVNKAFQFVSVHFESFEPTTDLVVFGKAAKVPHQIGFKRWNPGFDRLTNGIVQHMN